MSPGDTARDVKVEKVPVHYIKQMLLTHAGAEGRLCHGRGRKPWQDTSEESSDSSQAVRTSHLEQATQRRLVGGTEVQAEDKSNQGPTREGKCVSEEFRGSIYHSGTHKSPKRDWNEGRAIRILRKQRI